MSLYRQGKLAEAEACFQALLEGQPENSHLWHIQGIIAAQLKQFPEAILRLDRASQLNPDEPEIYNNIGKVRTEQGEFRAAIESLHQAIALNPTVADYHVNLGQALKA
ncbi:MAG: tetratricopeptide repeat protein, partial [Cyanobacteria bacterium P01_E01_bin.34]